jgi:predicted transcriptional regulator
MSRTLTIPQGQAKNLIALAKGYEEEAAGRLLYRQEGQNCIVDSGYITGSGTETSLTEDSEALEVVGEFLQRNPEWDQAPYHTHTQKTVDEHGECFAQNWSHRDMKNIERESRGDSDYMAVLATPETILVEGMDSPNINVLQDQASTRYNEPVNEALDKIADDLDYTEDWNFTEH